MDEEAIIKPRRNGRLLAVVGILLIALIAGSLIAFVVYYNNKILPGVSVNGLHLGGEIKNEARMQIKSLTDKIKAQGIVVTDGPTTLHLENKIVWNNDDALARAYGVGRGNDLWTNIADAATALIHGVQIPVSGSLGTEELAAMLKTSFSEDEIAPADAALTINMNGNTLVSAAATPEANGHTYDYAAAETAINDMLAKMAIVPVQLKEIPVSPTIFSADISVAARAVPSALALAPLTIMAEEKKVVLDANKLASLLVASKDENNAPILALDHDKLTTFLKPLSDAYDIPASDTYLEIDTTTNRMTSFKAGRDGRRVNTDKTLALVINAYAAVLAGQPTPGTLTAVTETAKSQVVSNTAAALGIKEVLGTGRSNYKVSSAARIKNIANGVAKLNGLLIAPDETFSTLAALGPFTTEGGYVPELVILGDKIEPAIGGGLCQIGTTTFRAAMNSGLPILERQNHSLVINHYLDPQNNEPGTDATIYDPSPDLKFKNDTGNWLLFTADMNRKTGDLAFSFWGTPDGRVGSYAAPKLIRWIDYPPDIKNIETDTLTPGKTTCQNPFRGADASFVYTVLYPDGTKKEKTFTSHYKPLQKICMVGVTAPAATPPDGTTPTAPAATPPLPATATNTPVLPPEAAIGN